jgi:hypothetical protein
LKNLVVIGIGGSYLGIEFVYEALCNAVENLFEKRLKLEKEGPFILLPMSTLLIFQK